MNKIFAGLMLSAVMVLGACATPRGYNRIDAEARPNLNKVETILLVTQSEIGAEIEVSNLAVNGGLIQAMMDTGINTSRTKKAEELIGPLRDKLIDYDYAANLETYLEAELAKINVDGISSVELKRAADKDYLQEKVSSTSADAVMYISSSYQLTPNFDSVVSSADVAIYPRVKSLNAYKDKPDDDENMVEIGDNIYLNKFRSVIPLEVAGDLELNAEAVAKITMAEWNKVLNMSADRLAKQIAADFLVDDDVTN